MENLKYPLLHNNISYPGMFKKFGVTINGVNYMLKISNNDEQDLSIHCEIIGSLLCDMMKIPYSKIKLVRYGNNTGLLSTDWKSGRPGQFFPLASYFEELIDTSPDSKVEFSYELFKSILLKKCPAKYEDILRIFWRLNVIDYLICNARSAGNIGFIDSDSIKLVPIYDNSTWLCSCEDVRYMDKNFPHLLMKFGVNENSGLGVFSDLDDNYKNDALRFAINNLNIFEICNAANGKHQEFMSHVINYRFNMLLEYL